jgi:hypothetical protein
VNTEYGWVLPTGLLEHLRRRDRERAAQAQARARRLFFVRKWLEARGEPLPDGVAEWRRLHEGEDLGVWQRANGLAPRRFEVLATRKAACEAATARVEELVPNTRATLDAESRFVVAWADENGVTAAGAPPGSAELAAWVVDHGPRFFGYTWEDEPETWELLQIEGEAAALARAFFTEVPR